ncbi:hypothetical protein SAMN05661080_05095 [Modestobacter sp. DSM 44400]|uniref:hypothetical protein n=1 Tax=Modestobacter sp. DSM 44400 TaxID=1550230 RepID=UPI00089B39C1|nr:hypothetical protein [Modestobacter sp. DSM 44400]SDY94216.1 hypothetical protein SAMN05661080_05095 [Modestobacter sp. DSM 44400]
MPLIVVHVRRDDVSPAQFDQVCQALPPGSDLPAGCCSHELKHAGRAWATRWAG